MVLAFKTAPINLTSTGSMMMFAIIFTAQISMKSGPFVFVIYKTFGWS